MKEIVLELDPEGEAITIEVKGERGRSCLETTRFLENALGEVTDRKLKASGFGERTEARVRLRARDPDRRA